MNNSLTKERLIESYTYDPITGIFKNHRGKSVGAKHTNRKNGKTHLKICIDGKFYRCHRLAWLYMTGNFPKYEIDHIDGNSENNIFSNLRDVTHQENCKNFKLYKNNKSGISGVHFNKSKQRWVAGDNKQKCEFKNKEDAIAYRKYFNVINGYHPNHGS